MLQRVIFKWQQVATTYGNFHRMVRAEVRLCVTYDVSVLQIHVKHKYLQKIDNDSILKKF